MEKIDKELKNHQRFSDVLDDFDKDVLGMKEDCEYAIRIEVPSMEELLRSPYAE